MAKKKHFRLHALVIAIAAVGFFTLLGTVSVSADSVAVPFAPAHQQLLHGGFKLIGNNSITCNPDAVPSGIFTIYPEECEAARNYISASNGGQRNNGQWMMNIDQDSDSSTFNSSSARLTIPAGSTVKYARLFWAQRSNNDVNGTLDNSMLFKKDGQAYATVTDLNPQTETSQSVDHTEMSVDVTDIVKQGGAGDYWGANVQTGNLNSIDMSAGWALYVVYENPSEPLRLASLFDGNVLETASGNGTTVALENFKPAGTSTAGLRIGMMVWDGDLGTQTGTGAPNDRLFINGQAVSAGDGNSDRATNDMFVSEITDENQNIVVAPNRNPADKNTFGQDIFNIDGSNYLSSSNDTLSVEARAGFVSDDFFWIDLFAVQVDIEEPVVHLTKAVAVSDPSPQAGSIISYEATLSAEKAPLVNTDIEDTIPLGTSYVPGSLEVLQDDANPANVGVKTDVASDDTADFDTVNPNKVVFRVGDGANSTTGGVLHPGETARVRFSVKVDNANLAIAPNCSASYNDSYFNGGQGSGSRGSDFDGDPETIDNQALAFYYGGSSDAPFDYQGSPAHSNTTFTSVSCPALENKEGNATDRLAGTGNGQQLATFIAAGMVIITALGLAGHEHRKAADYRLLK